MLRWPSKLVLLAAGMAALAQAQTAPDPHAPDVADPVSTAAAAAATTDTRFTSPLVDYVPQSATVPSPRKFFHRIMGAPGELLDSEQAYAYARALAAASPRVRVFTLGRSEEGREIILIAIADRAGMGQLDQLKADNAALADPRRVDAAEAERLIGSSRPFYYINAALHSDETASTEAVLELAYRLAVSETPMIRRIRANTVVLINPVSNPDGRDKQVEWFYEYLKGKTDLATLPRQAPPYWAKYVYVDINRDAHQLTQSPFKAVAKVFFDYHPVVIHDLHESEPLLMAWNGTGPYNPHIDPLTYGEFLALGFDEVERMSGFGMPGVATWNFGEAFSHLYLDSIAMNHNATGRGYEAFGNGTAETLVQTLSPDDTSREWWRPLPGPKGPFRWSMRNTLNYEETGLLIALDEVAGRPREFLRDFYEKGLHSWQAGVDEPPYAFLIPRGQGDPLRVAQMVERLQAQHIEVSVATAPITVAEGRFPAGTYVVRADQPYRNYAVDLLTPQHYPKDGEPPYDDVSWELPANYHLDALPTADTSIRNAALTPLAEAPHVAGHVSGAGPVYLLKDTGQESFLAARYRLANFEIQIAERAFDENDAKFPAGSWIIAEQPGLREAIQSAAAELGLDFTQVAAPPDVPHHAAKAPRIGVWVPWADTDSIGWIRYSLDQRKVPYTYLRDEDIRAGNLSSKIDVLLYGHVDLELAEQIEGLPKRWSPMPFKKTPQTPSFGTPAESDDITGGIGYEGLTQIQRFIDDGGLMVTLGSGSMLALEGGLVRFVRRSSGGVPRSTAGGGGASSAASQQAATRTPGAHVRVTFDRPDHPIAYGYPTHTWVFRQNFPLYNTPRRWLRMAYCTTCLDGPEDRSGIVMEWGDASRKDFVVSGQAWGEENLIGRPAILDMPVGNGHVVSFNFNPMHRDMNRGDQRLLWNAILNWQAIVAMKPKAQAGTAPEPDE